jgi:hypothetical protein
LRNILELNGNLKGTYGNTLETREKWKKILPPTSLKGKKTRHLDCMLGPSHGLHEISLPKRASPFLAWSNTHCKEHPTYRILETKYHINYNSFEVNLGTLCDSY